MRVSWTARRSTQSILKEINPEYSLEGLLLKLKLQSIGHLMQRAESLKKTLMLVMTEGKRRSGWQRMRWLDSITDLMDMNMSKLQGFPGGSDGKESTCHVGDLGSIPGSGRSPGGWHGNPVQYSCLENPHGRRSLTGYSPCGCTESDTTETSKLEEDSGGRRSMVCYNPWGCKELDTTW